MLAKLAGEVGRGLSVSDHQTGTERRGVVRRTVTDAQRIVINPAKHQGKGGPASWRNYPDPSAAKVVEPPKESWWMQPMSREEFVTTAMTRTFAHSGYLALNHKGMFSE